MELLKQSLSQFKRFSASFRSWLNFSPVSASLIAGLMVSAVYLYFFAFKAHVELEIKLDTQVQAWFKVYWADEGEPYTEARMQQVLIDGVHRKYSMFIDNLTNITKLRIDPIEFKSGFEFRTIKITQVGFKDIEFSKTKGFDDLIPVQHIDNILPSELGLQFKTIGRDSQFEYHHDAEASGLFPFEQILVVISILLVCFVLGKMLGGLQRNIVFVPLLLLIVVALAFTMAMLSKHYIVHSDGVSRVFIHPDEEVHAVAAEYYSDHWLPPAIDSEEIKGTFSVYGYSRLASHEIYYPVAGYISRLLKPLRQPYMTDLRLVGILMILFLAVYAYRQPSFRPFVVPLLITPQLWYLYSYANSDGFAVMLATIMAYQSAVKDSALNRIVSEPQPKNYLFHLSWIGLLVGALLLLKQNFYFFILFLGLYLLWRIFNGDFPNHKLLWTRLIYIALIGASLFVARMAIDYGINGMDRHAKIAAMIEEKAETLYKPSTDLKKKHIYLYMKDRGIDLKQIIFKEKWFGKTFISSFGAYGYTQYLGGREYYKLVQAIGLALLGVIILSAILWGSFSGVALVAITIGCSVLLIVVSLLNSWMVSFQAQGRYFAPILPMLGVLYYHARPWLMNRVFNFLLLALFLVGLYSFVFIGLADIPKIS